ncbi:MAG: ROK family protein [Verrucomicrobia bacterium]|nr:ROK family protein [Verrucomicrobiota bacterium]
MIVLGIDIGGSGIKAAPVETGSGEFLAKRLRLETPPLPSRQVLLGMLKEVVRHFNWSGPVGIGFPGVVRMQTVCTAANLGPALANWTLAADFTQATGLPCSLLNDADAAGLAEVRLGAGRGKNGTILVVTVGTGVGSALFHNGMVFPNTELGHMAFRGREAEKLISEKARKELDLSWKDWGRCFNSYLGTLEKLFWPDLFILGGGGVKKTAKIEPWLRLQTPVAFAEFGNKAGIIGAALHTLNDPHGNPAR